MPAPRWRSAAAVLGALRAPDGCRGAGADRPGRPGHPGRCGGPGPGYGLGTSPAGHGRSWQVKASLVLGRKLLHSVPIHDGDIAMMHFSYFLQGMSYA